MSLKSNGKILVTGEMHHKTVKGYRSKSIHANKSRTKITQSVQPNLKKETGFKTIILIEYAFLN